jgi:hypothetical protein
MTDDRLPVGDAVEVKVLAQRQSGRHLGKRRRFANGGDQSHAVLDTSRGAMAENLDRRDVVLGQGGQAKMTCVDESRRKRPIECHVMRLLALAQDVEMKFRRATRLVFLGEADLHRVLNSYARYYDESRIHRSLSKDAPFPRAIERLGVITSLPVLGGLQPRNPAVLETAALPVSYTPTGTDVRSRT